MPLIITVRLVSNSNTLSTSKDPRINIIQDKKVDPNIRYIVIVILRKAPSSSFGL